MYVRNGPYSLYQTSATNYTRIYTFHKLTFLDLQLTDAAAKEISH